MVRERERSYSRSLCEKPLGKKDGRAELKLGRVFQECIDIGKFVLDIGGTCPVITLELEKGASILLLSQRFEYEGRSLMDAVLF